VGEVLVVLQRTLDAGQVAAFRKDGVAKIAGCVDPRWIEALLSVAEVQLANPSWDASEPLLRDRVTPFGMGAPRAQPIEREAG